MKLILKVTAGIILAVVILVVGIAALASSGAKHATQKRTYIVKVNAPVGHHWSGAFGNRTVDGIGARTVTVKDIAITSANAQKQDAGNWVLKLTLTKNGKVLDSASTSAQYGLAQVSGSDF